ncbi:DNA repair protein RecN [Litoribrevibacter albus]|uniref:DNA repair protein RecN n=1 Tax=Litoribrevibacter albus TaxID=1473156 RepID=A0AA37W4C3_9GAMM|nr:DNA repair protein RecN [Litoribrevibacter albus]GLQ29680.1 DNA repair protein RecN [Litoribrevibacter albus]
MLQSLSVHNFAIADHIELQLENGLTVITGETGAGKSIMLDALCMASGDRADSGVVKYGAEKAEISACFDIHHLPEVQQWLIQEDLDDEDQCVIRRVITKEGRSRGYINGRPSPISKLRTLGEQLVEIHSQHAHQTLMQAHAHIHMLDNFGAHKSHLLETQQAFKQWQATKKQLDQLASQQDELNDKKQLLTYQLEELDTLNLQEGELEQIEQEHHRLSQAEELKQQSYQVYELTNGESGPASTSARDLLRQISSLTDHIDDQHPSLVSAKELYAQALINIEEASNEVLSYHETLEINPEQLSILNQRLTDIHDLARKHRINPDEIPSVHQQVAEELSQLLESDLSLETLQARETETRSLYLSLATELHDLRVSAAQEFDQCITTQLARLGMNHCKFKTRIDALEENKASSAGMDYVEFEVSSNPGQPYQSLAKVASGGELSRISLAIQVVNASRSQIPTLVFDEVDVGIGGATAEIVGELLKTIGSNGQVISVTHQAQVAAQGDQHLKASKTLTNEATSTQMLPLNREGRIKEIARMMGGQQMTDATLQLAEEMLV